MRQSEPSRRVGWLPVDQGEPGVNLIYGAHEFARLRAASLSNWSRVSSGRILLLSSHSPPLVRGLNWSRGCRIRNHAHLDGLML
jgi:hypothetical protein